LGCYSETHSLGDYFFDVFHVEKQARWRSANGLSRLPSAGFSGPSIKVVPRNVNSAWMAETISCEMGAPISLSRKAQAPAGLGHLAEIVKVLEHFQFEELKGSTLMRKEPIGVCGLITPWNWPMNQIVTKVAPALAAGCTMVLKPSEMAPLSAYLFAQILHEAAVPPGVFNLVNGDGPTVGAAIASHPDVAMVSFTGSPGWCCCCDGCRPDHKAGDAGTGGQIGQHSSG
jgi:hypothetical protein